MSQIMRRRLNITTVYIISKGIKKASMNAESHLNLNVLLQYYPEVAAETFKVLYGALSRPLVVDNLSNDCTT